MSTQLHKMKALFKEMLNSTSFISSLRVDAEELRAADHYEGNLDPKECPDAGLNDEAVAGPDAACREERC